MLHFSCHTKEGFESGSPCCCCRSGLPRRGTPELERVLRLMGVGDELLALGDAHRLRIGRNVPMAIGDGTFCYPSPIYNHVRWLWQQPVFPDDLEWVISYPGHRPYCDYELMISTAQERYGRVNGWRHAFKLLGRKYWRRNYRATPAPVVLTGRELMSGAAAVLHKSDKPVVLIEPDIKPGASPNKLWPLERYQTVVDARSDRVNFVQFGRSLQHVHALRPQDFRHAMAVLANSAAYLGNEGGLHHAAAAVGKPAVVIFGGYINPSVTGYDFHRNLFVECEDEGCIDSTPAGQAALLAISVEEVIAALDAVLENRL